MCRNIAVLSLILAISNFASATIIDVVPVDIGQSGGRLGGPTDGLQASDIIGLKIVLNYNQNTQGDPAQYDGYLLSSMDLDLHVLGAGSLDTLEHVQWGPNAGDPLYRSHAGLSPFIVDDADGIGNGIDKISGVALTDIQSGGTALVWDLILHYDGDGDVILDLTVNGLSEYKNDAFDTGYSALTEADLGDLVIYHTSHEIPEPMTLALLGLGGLLLRRRK